MSKGGKTSIGNPSSGTVSFSVAMVCRKPQRKGLFPWQNLTSTLSGVTQQQTREQEELGRSKHTDAPSEREQGSFDLGSDTFVVDLKTQNGQN